MIYSLMLSYSKPHICVTLSHNPLSITRK